MWTHRAGIMENPTILATPCLMHDWLHLPCPAFRCRSQVLTRRNVYTGLEYRVDPTILGWNLINEPRCSSYEASARACLLAVFSC